MRHTLIAGLVAGSAGALTIWLYLIVTLGLIFHVPQLALYTWDASNFLGYAAAARAGPTAVVAIGEGGHVLVSLGWGLLYALLARRWAALRTHPWLGGIVYGALVMQIMHFVVVPLGHAPQNAYTPAGFANNLIAHTLAFGLPVALVVRRLSS